MTSQKFGDKVIIYAGMLSIMLLVIIIGIIVGIGIVEWDFAYSTKIVLQGIGKLFSHCLGFC